MIYGDTPSAAPGDPNGARAAMAAAAAGRYARQRIQQLIAAGIVPKGTGRGMTNEQVAAWWRANSGMDSAVGQQMHLRAGLGGYGSNGGAYLSGGGAPGPMGPAPSLPRVGQMPQGPPAAGGNDPQAMMVMIQRALQRLQAQRAVSPLQHMAGHGMVE